MRKYFSFALLLFCPVFVLGQDVHKSVHSDNAQLVDGATHPEMVPDSTAYRMFFIAASLPKDATPEEKAQQKAKLDPIGLSDAEVQVGIDIIDQFSADYTDLINTYNVQAAAASEQGVPPDLKSFLENRDLLVWITRESLRSALTSEGLAQFDIYVQSEKRRMLVNMEVQ